MKKDKAIEKALGYMYYHDKPNFTHNGFTFVKSEYYEVEQDSHWIVIIDDNGEYHLFDYNEASEVLSC